MVLFFRVKGVLDDLRHVGQESDTRVHWFVPMLGGFAKKKLEMLSRTSNSMILHWVDRREIGRQEVMSVGDFDGFRMGINAR